MKKPCEYCGCDLPLGVDKNTRRIRSRHFSSCKARPNFFAVQEDYTYDVAGKCTITRTRTQEIV